MNNDEKNSDDLFVKRLHTDSLDKIRLSEIFWEYQADLKADEWTHEYVEKLKAQNVAPEFLDKVKTFVAIKDHYIEALYGSRAHKAALYFKLGKYSFEQKQDYLEALQRLTIAIDCDPTNAEAYLYLGFSLGSLEKQEKAIFVFSKAIQLRPEYTHAYIGRAMALYFAGEYLDALKDFSKTLEVIFNYSGVANILYLTVNHLKDENEVSLDKIKEIIGFDIEKATDFYDHGSSLMRAGNLEEALEFLRESIKLNPFHFPAQLDYALALLRTDAYEKAAQHYAIAIELKSENWSAQVGYGIVLGELGHYEDSLVFMKKAAELIERTEASTDDLALVFCNYGASLARVGQNEAALHMLAKALDAKPNDSMSLVNLGVVLMELDDYTSGQSLELFKKAIIYDPKLALAYNNCGALLTNRGQHKDAIEYFQKAIELDPRYAFIYYDIGLSLFYLEDWKGALYFYDQAIEHNPDNIDAHNNRGVVLAYLNEYTEAKKAFERVLAISPENVTAKSNLENNTPQKRTQLILFNFRSMISLAS